MASTDCCRRHAGVDTDSACKSSAALFWACTIQSLAQASAVNTLPVVLRKGPSVDKPHTVQCLQFNEVRCSTIQYMWPHGRPMLLLVVRASWLLAFLVPLAAPCCADCKQDAFVRVVWLTALCHRYEGADAVDADAVGYPPGLACHLQGSGRALKGHDPQCHRVD